MNKNKIIVGSAIGLAAIAVAIDHTRHRVPSAVSSQQGNSQNAEYDYVEDDSEESPCSLGNPCALNLSPCGLD